MWRLPIAYGLFVGGVCAAIATTRDSGAEQVTAVIRATAFMSSVPFLLAFVASSAHRLRPSATTRWLVANRRYVGLSVSGSHSWHLVAIIVYVRNYAAGPLDPLIRLFGTAGFVMLGLMAATSTDGAQRALGRAWGWLHWIGVYVLWLDFIFTYMGTATEAPFHALMTITFAAAWTLRVLAYTTTRTRSLTSATRA